MYANANLPQTSNNNNSPRHSTIFCCWLLFSASKLLSLRASKLLSYMHVGSPSFNGARRCARSNANTSACGSFAYSRPRNAHTSLRVLCMLARRVPMVLDGARGRVPMALPPPVPLPTPCHWHPDCHMALPASTVGRCAEIADALSTWGPPKHLLAPAQRATAAEPLLLPRVAVQSQEADDLRADDETRTPKSCM